ncbi:MAG: acetate--CoA ligase, partial [Chromatiales bacterium]|nr:acetate--CoA ligase [Chromatiales bacterium]
MSDIDSILHEDRLFPPPSQFSRGAGISAAQLGEMYRAAEHDYAGFWAAQARREIDWREPFTHILDDSRAPHFRWFDDGVLNVSWNCIDRHLASHADKTAIIFEGEPGDVRRLTYAELHRETCRLANALRARGVRAGDRIIIYMPMVPEAVIAMQACARIGAIHSVVFGGFSANALRERIDDASAKAVITADGGHRAGRIIELKAAADQAVKQAAIPPELVIVLKRTGHEVAMQSERDIWWHDAIATMDNHCEPEWVSAEHPLFILYTSGSTGKPKGIQHSSAGYLLGAITTMRWVFDHRDDDIYWCTADVGWITGHSYVAYGPLALGGTVMIYEGAPTVPNAGRFWEICERQQVTVFYTAPTAIRALMKFGDEIPARYDLSRLRLLGTVGEPINPEAWMWYHRIIGKEHCPIVDTWWQTETGANMIAPVPGVVATKPGSCTRPLPGIDAAIVDDQGEPVTAPDKGGYLVIRKPWPSMLRTIWGDDQRFKDTYWSRFDSMYFAGDGAKKDADGDLWLLGRVD